MNIVRSKKALTEAIRGLRAKRKVIGFVPTMGALHDGHVSLVKIALEHSSAAVASVFVNPTQFGPGEDYSKYPRTEAEDLEKLAAAEVAVVYLPTVEEMYPEGAVTRVQVPGLNAELEGAVRPGHFDGVATIVTKLFQQCLPDVAVFGEKDYQQLCVIRQFTRDLDIPVRIIGAPIVREKDGLAMSSRNRYLNEKERKIAAALYRTLNEAAAEIESGGNVVPALAAGVKSLLRAGFAEVNYFELRDAVTLAKDVGQGHAARLLAAARVGTTRLLDNIAID